jgi:hypothetical protein
MTDRIDLPDGAWATFRSSYGWGPSIRIQATLIDGDGSEAFMRALVRETVTGCHLPTDAGGWLDWSATPDKPTLSDADMDNIAGHVGDAVLARCSAAWNAWRKGRPDPKGTSAPSTDTPQGNA